MKLGILDWQSEKALTAYPLERGMGIDDVFLDANFVQFDGFVPVLKSAQIDEHTITFTITFDSGDQAVTLTDTSFTSGDEYKFYDGTRYLGRLVFGNGVKTLWVKYTTQTVTYNIRFFAGLVRPIPTAAGVYSIQKKFGAVTMASDSVISFGVVGNIVTFNAIGLPDLNGLTPLKTINGVAPVGNNVSIQDNELLKVASNGAEVQFSLIGANLRDILTEMFTVIPTKQ